MANNIVSIQSQSDFLAFIKDQAMPNGNLSIRGVARCCGIDDRAIIKGAEFVADRVAQMLTQNGFDAAELIAAREIREITDLLDDNPRLAQVLKDSIINRVVERAALPGTAERLRGVAEIANEMGFRADASNRVKLGNFIKARGFEAKKENRSCNGVDTAINCYIDTPILRDAIADFFEH